MAAACLSATPTLVSRICESCEIRGYAYIYIYIYIYIYMYIYIFYHNTLCD
jgi:hypothetical protein